MPETLTSAVSEGVATIILDRPERLNAYNPTMFTQVLEAFDATDTDDDVRAVVGTGAGQSFCAGADLGAGGRTLRSDIELGEGPARRDTGGALAFASSARSSR